MPKGEGVRRACQKQMLLSFLICSSCFPHLTASARPVLSPAESLFQLPEGGSTTASNPLQPGAGLPEIETSPTSNPLTHSEGSSNADSHGSLSSQVALEESPGLDAGGVRGRTLAQVTYWNQKLSQPFIIHPAGHVEAVLKAPSTSGTSGPAGIPGSRPGGNKPPPDTRESAGGAAISGRGRAGSGRKSGPAEENLGGAAALGEDVLADLPGGMTPTVVGVMPAVGGLTPAGGGLMPVVGGSTPAPPALQRAAAGVANLSQPAHTLQGKNPGETAALRKELPLELPRLVLPFMAKAKRGTGGGGGNVSRQAHNPSAVPTVGGAARTGGNAMENWPGGLTPEAEMQRVEALTLQAARTVLHLPGHGWVGAAASTPPPAGVSGGPPLARGMVGGIGRLLNYTGLWGLETAIDNDQFISRLLADKGNGPRLPGQGEEVCHFNRPGIDRCAYVQRTNICHDEQKYVPYLPAYACASRPGQMGLLLVYLLWLLLMFYSLSEVAEGFLVPAVEYIAERLKLAPAVAGVTLLSFAGGAPDLFTQLAAVSAGQGHVDLGLAISSTMGSGLFTACILTATVVLIRPLVVEDRGAFVRDAAAYVVACLALLGFLWNEKLGCAESAVLVSIYFVYVATALYASRGVQPLTAMAAGAGHAQGLHMRTSGAAEDDVGIEMACLGPVGQAQPGGATSGGPLVLTSPAKAGGGAAQTQTLRKTVSLVNGAPLRAIAVGAGTRAVTPDSYTAPSHPTDPSVFAGWDRPPPEDDAPPLSVDVSGTSTAESEWGESVQIFRGISGGAGGGGGNGAGAVGPWPSMGARWGEGWVDPRRWVPWEVVDALVRPLRGKGWAGALWAAVTAPLLLALHSTNPSLHIETYSAGYGVLLAAVVPGFSLLATGFTPRVLTPAGFGAAWLTGSAVILVAMLHRLRKMQQPFGPRRSSLMAFMSLSMSAIWLMVIADEMVALLQAVGWIFNFPLDMIGGTILAWGETVPELAATYSLAKAGQGTMALAACFGCPIFNTLMGLGLPVLYQSTLSGALDLQLTNGIFLLILQSIAVLLLLLVLVPLVMRWKAGKGLGWTLITLYVLFQLFFVLTEENVLWTTPWDPHTSPDAAQRR